MFRGNGHCVEKDKHDDEPVKPLGLDCVPNPES